MAGAREVEPQFLGDDEHPMVAHLANRVASMEPADRSILRATPAWKVLQSFGAAFRWTDVDLYVWSFPVWFHSSFLEPQLAWRQVHEEPVAAFAVQRACSSNRCHHLGFADDVFADCRVPAGRAASGQNTTRSRSDHGVCSVVYGDGRSYFPGRSSARETRSLVFLDQVCINQKNTEHKAKGIMSIGAFLKYSEKLLVVWDKTYAGRLWCMLELAAFLRSHEAPDDKVIIRPTAMAPCILGFGFAIWASTIHFILVSEQTPADTLVLFVTRWFFFYLAASYLREHYRDTESMLKQLSDFTVQGARCHCCNDGEACNASVCDRAIMSRCLRSWYGSVDAFEATVRTHVRTMLYRQLGGMLFPMAGTSWLPCLSFGALQIAWRRVGVSTTGRWLQLCFAAL